MASNMDRGLDEIIAEKRPTGPRNRRGGNGGDRRRNNRQDRPRDGVKKTYRNETRSIDSEWVHDRFEENDSGRRSAPRRQRDSPSSNEPRGTKIKVENVHYDLTEEDLDELFKRIGTVVRLQLRYDRQDRSLGVAYVTYEKKEDAEEAIRQFDGANANGQPIRLTMLGSRNAFDNAFMPGRPLAERVSGRRYDEDEAARRGIDRYIPGERPRSRSPGPRRRNGGGNGNRGDGRRPGARRDAARRDENKDGARGNPRPKKTQEELDADMDDYFTGDTNAGNGDAAAPAAPAVDDAPAAASGEAAAPQGDDVDMIE